VCQAFEDETGGTFTWSPTQVGCHGQGNGSSQEAPLHSTRSGTARTGPQRLCSPARDQAVHYLVYWISRPTKPEASPLSKAAAQVR